MASKAQLMGVRGLAGVLTLFGAAAVVVMLRETRSTGDAPPVGRAAVTDAATAVPEATPAPSPSANQAVIVLDPNGGAATGRSPETAADSPTSNHANPSLEVSLLHGTETAATAALTAQGLGVTEGTVPPLPEMSDDALPQQATKAGASENGAETTVRIFTSPTVFVDNTQWGVRVARLDGAARDAGLKLGDRLLRIDSERVFSAAQARSMLRGRRGTSVRVSIRRAGERLVVQLRRP